MNVMERFDRDTDTRALIQVLGPAPRAERTHRQLLENVSSLCIELRRRGVQPGDRVLILSGLLIQTLESMLAAFNLGAVAVPVNPLLGASNIEAIIRSLAPACCIFEEGLQPELAATLEPCCRLYISLKLRDAPGSSGWLPYESLLDEPSMPLARPEHVDDTPALIVYSSGSEGRPKGISMTHGSLATFLHHYDMLCSQFEPGASPARPPSPLVTVLPLSHLGGLGICLQGLMSGRTTYLMSPFLPEPYLRLLAAARCSLMMLVPSLYRSLLKEPSLPELDLSALRFCMTLGEACSAEFAAQIETAFAATAVSAYGLTECLTGIGHSRQELYAGGVKRGSCGTHCFGEVRLVDEHGQENAGVGELWVRNPTVRECYLDPELNGSRFAQGWFRTKDLFQRDADGHYFHRGRCDDMFVCNGKNIYPAEIEVLLMSHPAIELACAAPVMSKDNRTLPAVLILPRQPITEAEVLEYSAKAGPAHAIPQMIRFATSCPQVGPGKIDRVEAHRLLQDAYDQAHP